MWRHRAQQRSTPVKREATIISFEIVCNDSTQEYTTRSLYAISKHMGMPLELMLSSVFDNMNTQRQKSSSRIWYQSITSSTARSASSEPTNRRVEDTGLTSCRPRTLRSPWCDCSPQNAPCCTLLFWSEIQLLDQLSKVHNVMMPVAFKVDEGVVYKDWWQQAREPCQRVWCLADE